MTKPCKLCGKLFGDGLSPAHFARRRYCSKSCGLSDRDYWWLRTENIDPERLAARGRAIRAAKTGALGTVSERFWKKVRITPGCWLWTACLDDHGYGMFSPRGRRGSVRAHRWALEDFMGRPIRDGFNVCHVCDNPPCVWPGHLYEGTDQDNMDDRDGRGSALERRERWRTECGL